MARRTLPWKARATGYSSSSIATAFLTATSRRVSARMQNGSSARWSSREKRPGITQFTLRAAREAFNMAAAAVDGKSGSPNNWRNYRLGSIMQAANTR